jgi:hypothetical protein
MDSAAALFIFDRELSVALDHPGAAMKNGWKRMPLEDAVFLQGPGIRGL